MSPPWITIALSAAVLVVSFQPDYSIRQSYLWTTISFIAIAICCQFIYGAIIYPEFLSPIRYIPTPKGRSWLKGNNTSIFPSVPVERVRRWTTDIPNKGLIRCYMLGDLERVLVVGRDALNEMLMSKAYEFEKPESLRVKLVRILGNGLLVAERQEHKIQRKGLMPSFQFRHVKLLYPSFWSKSVEMANGIEKQLQSPSPREQVIQVRDWAQRATLDVIGTAGMGHDFGAIKNPHNTFSQELEKLRVNPTAIMKWILLIGMLIMGGKEEFFKLPIEMNKKSQEAAGYIRGVARQMVQKKKERQRLGELKENDVASIALASGVFTDEGLVDQMITMLVAGHETVAIAVQWAVVALCKNPEIQSRLREEIRTHLPATIPSKENPNPQPATSTQVDSLPYLNAFCNEVLRFSPPIRSTVRIASIDTSLCGVPIPKGTQLLIVPGATNLNPELWGPDAEVFNPERWMGEGQANNGGADSNYANLTFLHGPRGCIGRSFAKSEFACIVAVLTGRFKMELQDPLKPIEVIQSISATPKDGVMAKLTRLEGW